MPLTGGNPGGGVIQTATGFGLFGAYAPFARGARLNAMAESLREDNWPIDSLTPGSILGDDSLPPEAFASQEANDDGADH